MNHHAFWDIVPSVSLHLEASVLAHTVILSMVTTEILSSHDSKQHLILMHLSMYKMYK